MELYALGVSDQSDILESKKALRARMKAWRAGLGGDAQARAAEAVARQGLDFLQPRPSKGSIVSGFSPIADEFRIWPLLRTLAGEGYRLALPVMQG